MKTKKVRPVLIESKNNEDRQYPCILKYSHMFGDTKGKIGYFDCNIRTPAIKMEIILISLEDENIESGDIGFINIGSGTIGTVSYDKEYKTWDLTTKDNIHYPFTTREYIKKVIAIQDQIPSEYISKFIEQYNNGCIEDFEIEMEKIKNPNFNRNKGVCVSNPTYLLIPKFTNGFISVVEKELNFKNTDRNHLEWIYDRLMNIHGENPDLDYMLKLKSISESILYTEKEVLEIIDKYDTAKWGCSSKKSIDEITKWFELNKKK